MCRNLYPTEDKSSRKKKKKKMKKQLKKKENTNIPIKGKPK